MLWVVGVQPFGSDRVAFVVIHALLHAGSASQVLCGLAIAGALLCPSGVLAQLRRRRSARNGEA
jgi:hypothetical protein